MDLAEAMARIRELEHEVRLLRAGLADADQVNGRLTAALRQAEIHRDAWDSHVPRTARGGPDSDRHPG